MTLIVNKNGLTPDIAILSDKADLLETLGHVDEMALALISNSRDCVKILGLDGSLIFMNANGRCAMAVDDYDAIRDKAWPVLWPEEMRETITLALRTGRRGGVAQFIGTCPTCSGDLKIWDVLLTPVYDSAVSGQTASYSKAVAARRVPAYLLCVSKDVTDHHGAAVPPGGLRLAGFPIAAPNSESACV